MLLQLVFVSSLLMFLVTGLVVASDYQSSDVLFLRRIIRDDALRLGFLFNTPGLQAAHWSVFDGLSWAAQTINSATEKLLVILQELMKGIESRKIDHQTKKGSLKTETEFFVQERHKPQSVVESSNTYGKSNTRDNPVKNSDRYSHKNNQYEIKDQRNK